MLDNDGELICINRNQSVISQHDNPLSEYTQNLGDMPALDHASDARGVFCHVHDFHDPDSLSQHFNDEFGGVFLLPAISVKACLHFPEILVVHCVVGQNVIVF